MTKKKLFMLLSLLLVVFVVSFGIYKTTYKEEFNYVALGDSLAAGRNPYGVDDYGYTDYIRDFLKRENKLQSYYSYAVSGYKIDDVKNDILYGKSTTNNNESINIKKALRESDLVTISIGANDILSKINLSNLSNSLQDVNTMMSYLDEALTKINELITLIKQYAKRDIIVIGYYNPLPSLEQYEIAIDTIISYVDMEYSSLCEKRGVHYVQISDDMKMHNDYLPNPNDIHPGREGYKVISDEVIKVIKQHIFD